jgi:hypothetical protein
MREDTHDDDGHHRDGDDAERHEHGPPPVGASGALGFGGVQLS